MPFEVTNNVQEGSSWADFQNRNNPLANESNEIKVYGLNRPGCDDPRIDIDLTYQVNGAGASIDFTQNTAISGLRYYTISVTDEKGKEATGQLDITATTTLINIDTSALDASRRWKVSVTISGAVPGLDCDCSECYVFYINDIPSNPTDTITTAPVVGALAVQVDLDGVKTSVADGGTQALTAASVGDVVDVRIYITNATADSLVQISAGTAVTDGSFVQVAYVPVLVNDSIEVSEWVVRMDTATVGAKTCTVTFTSDDAASPYNFDLTLAVS